MDNSGLYLWNGFTSSGSSVNFSSAPVIQSTLEQIARNLAEYQAGGENIKPRTGKDEELTEKEEKYKPVRFPRNPTVLEILTILESEQRKKTQSGNKKSNEEDIEKLGINPNLERKKTPKGTSITSEMIKIYLDLLLSYGFRN